MGTVLLGKRMHTAEKGNQKERTMPIDNLAEGNFSELQRFEKWLASRGQTLTKHQKKLAKAFFSGGLASGKTFLICALFEYERFSS
jgi:hypothetical protein